MKIHVRFDDSNERHTRLTLFIGGANCGTLALPTTDIVNFCLMLRNGIHPDLDEYVETGHIYSNETTE